MTTARQKNRLIPALIITAGAVVLLVSFPAVAASPTDGGDVRILDARAQWETLNQIRADKFDLILPGAIRDNGVDMWIHVIRWGDPDPLALLAEKLEAEDFVYTPFTDIRSKDRAMVVAMGDDRRTGISIDCHTVGNTGNSEVAIGPSFAPFRPDRADVVIQLNNLFAFEFIIHHAIPDGTRLRINLEDNAVVTVNGVEWLYPPNSRILEIR